MKQHYFLRKGSAGWFRQSLLALSSLGLALTSLAQATNIQIGTGTGTHGQIPLNTNYGYNYTQQIYYASELIAEGVGTGLISKIRFYQASNATNNSQNWTIYMANTAKTEFTSTTDWEVMANLTQVFSGDVAFVAQNNWMEITLQTPFTWDGTSNLLIAIDENTPNYGSTSNWRVTATGAVNRSIYYRDDVSNPAPGTPPTATGRVTSHPNLQLEIEPTVACSTPVHGSAVTSAADVCDDGSAELSLDMNYYYTGISYQWQMNDGSGWTDIPGATGNTYTATNLMTTTEFRASVTCANTSDTDISAEVTVTVNPNPVVVIDNTDIAICDGEPATLTASGADTYLWSPNTALTPNTTSATVNVIPTATTTYTVVGTTAAGCSASATAKITPVGSVVTAISYDPSENCEAGSPVTAEVTGLPAAITSGGTWEYRWLAADGVTVLQDWNSSSSYTFIPTEDSVYGHFYQVRSTSCPMDYVDSVYSGVTIGFGAEDVELTHYDCNTLAGSIALVNPFGQILTEVLYDNPLSDAGNIDGFTLSNSASIANGRLQLTPSATGVSGYAMLEIPNFTPSVNNSFTLSFDLTADMPINIWGTGGGDGLCYSFGDDATPAGPGPGMNGKGSKLRLCFDAANNGSDNGNATGIYLVWGWTSGTAYGPGSTPQVLAYSPNTSWKFQTDIPVVLTIDAEGKATVTVGGTVVIDHIQLPAAYMNADVSNWKHLFSAQTGGDALRHAVSNLHIEKSSMSYGITAGGSATPPAASEWQEGATFDGLLPGTYDIWISKDATGTCLKNIGTYEVLNTNPVVDLGNDTTICEGETLLLDAGNPGSTYTWSGSNIFTQTMEVSEEGNYVVYVTDPSGCMGIGSIGVDVNEAPSVAGINVQGTYPNIFFAVTGATNADAYDWDFDDGSTLEDGPASVTHVYSTDGTFDVTVTVSNDCGSDTYTETITITDVTGIGENTIEGLEVYPNPASQNVTVKLPNNEETTISVYSASGVLVQAENTFHATASFDVSRWEKGVYFLRIRNQGKTGVTKLVVH